MIHNKKIFLILSIIIAGSSIQFYSQSDSLSKQNNECEVFPIINYDSDAGFGYGGKAFLYNFLSSMESFDLTIYNSTKGERWYRLAFSFPDIQRRQGKKYSIAFDLTLDYDKWINYKFYSSYNDNTTGEVTDRIENYIREPIELTALFSSGFTNYFVGELGARFKSISCYNFDSGGTLKALTPGIIKNVSFIFNLRWDTRINFINPQNGFVIEIDNELGYDIINPPLQNFYKIEILAQHYLPLIEPNFILANRIILQTISNVSYQLLLPLGGNNTVRGLPQDRYLSTSTALINSEFRFPVWKRLGGIAGIDIGNSKSTPDWIINPVVGLRFYMDNFVVRFDVGFGSKTTGIYFNFGHIF
ncbi:MAG: BamA/TamA family outer membrane protein [Ignavibacterium sp.]|nr:BamA/TamA family outer membrane protein [Ignavibacterium sp.]